MVFSTEKMDLTNVEVLLLTHKYFSFACQYSINMHIKKCQVILNGLFNMFLLRMNVSRSVKNSTWNLKRHGFSCFQNSQIFSLLEKHRL